jgi:hypothetical protein
MALPAAQCFQITIGFSACIAQIATLSIRFARPDHIPALASILPAGEHRIGIGDGLALANLVHLKELRGHRIIPLIEARITFQ